MFIHGVPLRDDMSAPRVGVIFFGGHTLTTAYSALFQHLVGENGAYVQQDSAAAHSTKYLEHLG